MDKELILLIDMLCMKSELIHVNGTREEIPTVQALMYAYETCKDEDIHTLHLMGNKKYIEGMILQYPPLNYGCGKVTIKVN